MRFLNYSPIVGASNADASTIGAAIDSNQLIKLSVQAVVTGTPTGSLQLQFSNDPIPVGYVFSEYPPTNWSNLGSPLAIGAAGVFGIAQQDLCYRSIRAVYTSTDAMATGVITVNIMALSI